MFVKLHHFASVSFVMVSLLYFLFSLNIL